MITIRLFLLANANPSLVSKSTIKSLISSVILFPDILNVNEEFFSRLSVIFSPDVSAKFFNSFGRSFFAFGPIAFLSNSIFGIIGRFAFFKSSNSDKPS